MKKIVLIYLLFIALLSTINAQIPGTPKNLLSPNAASLGLYGEIPVSLYTGTPNINIPLYEMTYGNINMPISVSYHASGIRPDQHPGWVGLGWNLNAGGMISRIIKGIPDDARSFQSNAWVEYGYYFNHEILNTDNWSSTKMTDIASCTNGMTTNTDSEPDEFIFNFLGYSGKFYYDAKGYWKIACDKPLKIQLIGLTDMPMFNNLEKQYHPQHFTGFIITDEYGNKYSFGYDNIEYSLDFFHQTTDWWNASSWLLTTIELNNGEVINFNYERGSFVNQLYCSYSANLGTYNTTGLLLDIKSSSPTLSNGGQLISPLYLKRIISPNDSIVFIRSNSKELQYDTTNYFTNYTGTQPYAGVPEIPYLKGKFGTTEDYSGVYSFFQRLKFLQWQQLDEIIIYSKKKVKNKHLQFLYSSSNTQRLTLKKIEEKSSDGINKNGTFVFDYYNVEKLPGYLSFQTDHWGYFNGKYSIIKNNSWVNYSGSYSLINQIDFNTSKYYQKREPSSNSDTLSFGSLKRIVYPTGGTTEFIYEPHDYQFEVNLNRWNDIVDTYKKNIAGGLRIKKIINYTNNINDTINKTTKEYIYKKNYPITDFSAGSSGVLGGKIKYHFENYKVKAFNDNNVTYFKNMFTSQSVLPACENTSGAHIGYSEVVEKIQNNGYTRYIFSNFDNGFKDEIYVSTLNNNLSPYQPYNNRNFERGQMISKSIYDENGSLKLKTSIKYLRQNADTNFVKSVYAHHEYITQNSAIYYIDGTANKIFTYSFLPNIQIDSIYESGNSTPIIKYVSYTYNSNKLLSKQVTCDSKGDTLTTRFKYSGDIEYDSNFTPLAQDTIFSTLQFMKNKNMIAYPVETITSKKKVGIGEKQWIINAKLQLYKKIKPTYAPVDFCKLYSEFELALTSPIQDITNFKELNLYLTSSNNQCIYDNRYVEKVRFNKYDAHGNPIWVTTNGIDNNVYLWSYSYLYPIAEIKNVKWQDVLSYISEIQVADLAKRVEPNSTDLTILSTIHTNLSSSLTSKYTFIPLVGIAELTNPQGIVTKYTYDNFNRLSTISDNKNNIVSQIQYKTVDINESAVQTSSSTLYARIFYSSKIFNVNNADIANIAVVGGSGNYTYNWKLLNSSGTVLASQLNSNATSFAFIYSQGGTMTIQCIVTDNQTGSSFSASTLRTVNCITGSFTMASGYYNITSNITNYGTYVSFYIAFIPSSTMVAGTSYLVANISANCRPSVQRGFFYSSTDRNWSITINPDGNIYFTIISSGVNLPAGNGVGFGTLTYNFL